MPLFECSNCHGIENTATSNYWWDVHHEGKPALCSKCDPAIGEWHGHFEQRPAAEIRAKDPTSFVEHIFK